MAKIFDPTAQPSTRPITVAPRPERLDGLRLGLVENTKFNADTLLKKLAERLTRDHGITVTHMARKRSPSHEVDEGAIAELRRRADIVISGIGD
jgi:hypothetical protein